MARQVFVGNLPFTATWGDLKDLVRDVAGVNAERADIMTNQMGKSRGFGTVLFASPAEAQRAIEVLNGYNYQGRNIEVREDRNAGAGGGARNQARPPPEQSSSGSAAMDVDVENVNLTHRSLYVGNLPYSVQWQDLKDLMRNAGNVVRADIPADYQGRSKGYGIVVMSSVDDARKAVAMYAGYEWNGRRLDVREDRSVQDDNGAGSAAPLAGANRARSGSVQGSSGQAAGGAPLGGTQLYVGNLPYSCSWQDVKDLMRNAGTVLRADVVTDGVRSKGYGTVVMATPADAARAIEMLNGAELQGRIIEVRPDRLAGGGAPRINPAGANSSNNNNSSNGNGGNGAAGAGTGTGTAVFLTNLPFTTRWQDIKDLFRPQNLLPTHADVILDTAGRSKGMGTVRFNSREDAERAVQYANGLQLQNRAIVARLDRFL